MLQYVNYRMRITILDGRVLVGTMMAFDRHLNLVSLRLLSRLRQPRPGRAARCLGLLRRVLWLLPLSHPADGCGAYRIPSHRTILRRRGGIPMVAGYLNSCVLISVVCRKSELCVLN